MYTERRRLVRSCIWLVTTTCSSSSSSGSGSSGCSSICDVHREKKAGTELYLAGNNYLVSDQRLSDDDVEVLCVALAAGNTYVNSLDLRYNNITDLGAKHVAQLLATVRHCVVVVCVVVTDVVIVVYKTVFRHSMQSHRGRGGGHSPPP